MGAGKEEQVAQAREKTGMQENLLKMVFLSSIDFIRTEDRKFSLSFG